MSKYARFFAILKQVNANGLELTKEQAVLDFTAQRTSSLSSLSIPELSALEVSLSALITQSRLKLPAIDPTADNLRKGIISQFKSIGGTVADAKAWAEKYGVFGNKRRFNDYTNQELWQLLQNAKKVKASHIKALTR